jgi:hypothetical protein
VVILRCTAKLLSLLGTQRADLAVAPPDDDDWYVNLLWIDRRKCLLFTHAGTLFSIFRADVLKADLRPLGGYAVDTIRAALADEGLPLDALGALDAERAQVAKTASRRVLGHMTEMGFQIEWTLDRHGGLGLYDPDVLTRELQRTLRNVGGHYADPIDLVHVRLQR